MIGEEKRHKILGDELLCKATWNALGLDRGFGIRLYEPSRQGYDLNFLVSYHGYDCHLLTYTLLCL